MQFLLLGNLHWAFPLFPFAAIQSGAFDPEEVQLIRSCREDLINNLLNARSESVLINERDEQRTTVNLVFYLN